MTGPNVPRGLDIAGHDTRVLIVDDERQNRQLLEVMLAPEGYLLETAGSGEEALGIVARHPPISSCSTS